MDVSKLSSWLNTNADWRVKGREGVHDAKRGAGREAGEGVWNGVAAAQVACTGGGPDSGRARDSGLVGARERT